MQGQQGQLHASPIPCCVVTQSLLSAPLPILHAECISSSPTYIPAGARAAGEGLTGKQEVVRVELVLQNTNQQNVVTLPDGLLDSLMLCRRVFQHGITSRSC